jgi:uncharacterized membrane protein YozB (DUF420 family)
MVSLFIAYVDLVLQISIFALLIAGLVVERKRKIKVHARLMLAAVVLNLVSFAAIMGPAEDSISKQLGNLSVIGTLHIAFGGLAMLASFWILGTWLVPSLIRQSPKLRCYGKTNKRIMTALTVLWLAALVAGFVLFVLLNL